MRLIKNLLLFIVLAAVLLILIGFLLPQEIAVVRTTKIEAPAAKIFPHINDFRKFQAWSPWAKIDPEGTKVTYEGPDSGVGHKVIWSSDNHEVGKGSQEIVESVADGHVKTLLDFREHGKANAVVRLTPDGSGTTVSWGFTSDLGANPIARWMGLMIGPMVGEKYDEGLASLKTIIQSLPETDTVDPPSDTP